MKKTSYLLLGLLLVASLTAACVNLKNRPLERRSFVLEVQRDAQPREDNGKLLRLGRLGITPVYGGKGLVYRLENGEVQSDYYNEFFSSPELMLSLELSRWLRKAAFADVVPQDSAAIADASLEGVVTALYGDFRKATPEAVVEMQFFLVDERGGTGVLFNRTYLQRQPLEESSPEAVVKGMNLAVEKIYSELESDMSSALSASGS